MTPFLSSIIYAQTRGGNVGGTFGPLNNITDAPNVFNRVISSAIGLLTIVAGIGLVFLILSGGIAWMNAGGDKGAVEEARKRIFTGVVGLVIVIAAIFVADLLGFLIGFDILNPGGSLNNLTP